MLGAANEQTQLTATEKYNYPSSNEDVYEDIHFQKFRLFGPLDFADENFRQ